MRVLGPPKTFYHEQIATFRLGGQTLSVIANPRPAFENYGVETLDSGGGTSPMNESSVILWIQAANTDGVLLTGDAGVLGIGEALLYPSRYQVPVRSARCVQIPHHGSRRNVSPDMLNAMLESKGAWSPPAPKDSAHIQAVRWGPVTPLSRRRPRADRRIAANGHAGGGWMRARMLVNPFASAKDLLAATPIVRRSIMYPLTRD